MCAYFAAVHTELEQGIAVSQLTRERLAALTAEYRYLAEAVASQYGSIQQNFTGEGHLFLFEDADGALQACIRILESWKSQWTALVNSDDISTPLRLRIGCHFGEYTQMAGFDTWVTKGNIPRGVAQCAEPDTVHITETVLDLVDPALYRFESAGNFAIPGDHLPSRNLYLVTAVVGSSVQGVSIKEMTAEDCFLEAVALTGTRRENSDEEAKLYRQALAIRPNYPEAHNNLGVLLRANGLDSDAAEHYREALQLRPDYPEAHFNYAVLLQSRQSLSGAAHHYQEALRLRPNYVDANYGYASLLKANGNLDEAQQHYQQALSLRPEYAEVHNNLAILLEDKGDHPQAEKHYREALRMSPGYAEAHYNYAILLENTSDISGAKVQYLEALNSRHDYPEAHNNLAILLHMDGDLAGAELYYLKALERRGDDPQAHYNFALLLRAKGDETESERHFKIAYDLAPLEWMAAVQEQTGRHDSASDASNIGLTPREVEVLSLIALGRSNREIADSLVISLSTVSHHVTNILNKTGTSNRTEAAAYATQQRLT